jgi:hypothetical protein
MGISQRTGDHYGNHKTDILGGDHQTYLVRVRPILRAAAPINGAATPRKNIDRYESEVSALVFRIIDFP